MISEEEAAVADAVADLEREQQLREEILTRRGEQLDPVYNTGFVRTPEVNDRLREARQLRADRDEEKQRRRSDAHKLLCTTLETLGYGRENVTLAANNDGSYTETWSNPDTGDTIVLGRAGA